MNIKKSKTKRAFVPSGLDRLEDRVVLSTMSPIEPVAFAEVSAARSFQALPILTTRTFNQVVRQVDKAFTRAASGGNIERLASELSAASSRIPYGRAELLPFWLDRVDSVSDRASLGAAYQGVRADLNEYVRDGVDSGLFAFRQTGNLGRDAMPRNGGRLSPISRPGMNTPVLTNQTLSQVVRQVDRAFSRAAKSGNVQRLAAELSIASSRLPYGRQELLPIWLDSVDTVVDRPSLGDAYQSVRAELANYVHSGVDSGLFILR